MKSLFRKLFPEKIVINDMAQGLAAMLYRNIVETYEPTDNQAEIDLFAGAAALYLTTMMTQNDPQFGQRTYDIIFLEFAKDFSQRSDVPFDQMRAIFEHRYKLYAQALHEYYNTDWQARNMLPPFIAVLDHHATNGQGCDAMASSMRSITIINLFLASMQTWPKLVPGKSS